DRDAALLALAADRVTAVHFGGQVAAARVGGLRAGVAAADQEVGQEVGVLEAAVAVGGAALARVASLRPSAAFRLLRSGAVVGAHELAVAAVVDPAALLSRAIFVAVAGHVDQALAAVLRVVVARLRRRHQ